MFCWFKRLSILQINNYITVLYEGSRETDVKPNCVKQVHAWTKTGPNIYAYQHKWIVIFMNYVCEKHYVITKVDYMYHMHEWMYRHSVYHLNMHMPLLCFVFVGYITSSWRIPAYYNDVIMGAIAPQITSLTIVYWTVYSDADQRNNQSSASLAFVRGIHRWPVNFRHK